MQQTAATKIQSCKEMGGATSVMSVIRGAFSQWAADADKPTIDWTVRCDWLQVASVVTFSLHVLTSDFYLASYIVVVMALLRDAVSRRCSVASLSYRVPGLLYTSHRYDCLYVQEAVDTSESHIRVHWFGVVNSLCRRQST